MLVLNLEEKPPSKLLNPLKGERTAGFGSKPDPVISSAATRPQTPGELLTLTAAQEKTPFSHTAFGESTFHLLDSCLVSAAKLSMAVTDSRGHGAQKHR